MLVYMCLQQHLRPQQFPHRRNISITVQNEDKYPVREVVALSDGRLLSMDLYGDCLLWSPAEEGEGGGFRSESVSGRVFVDEAVHWVVKSGDVIAVFEGNGRDHWFREVSG